MRLPVVLRVGERVSPLRDSRFFGSEGGRSRTRTKGEGGRTTTTRRPTVLHRSPQNQSTTTCASCPPILVSRHPAPHPSPRTRVDLGFVTPEDDHYHSLGSGPLGKSPHPGVRLGVWFPSVYGFKFSNHYTPSRLSLY